MSERAAAVLTEVLAWPADQRGEFAAKLLNSLDPASDADAIDAWDQEIGERLDDVDSGRATPISWEEARRQIEADDHDAD